MVSSESDGKLVIYFCDMSTENVQKLIPSRHTLLRLVEGQLLTPQDVDRIERLYQRKDRLTSLCSTLLQRWVLSQVLCVPSDQVPILRRPGRKPTLRAPYSAEWNTSHDGDSIVVASLPSSHKAGYLGIDVMELKLPHRHASVQAAVGAIKRQLTQNETQWILEETYNKDVCWFDKVMDNLSNRRRICATVEKAFSNSEALLRFFMVWTAKEAYLKAVGCGIIVELARIDIHMVTPISYCDEFYDTGISGSSPSHDCKSSTTSPIAILPLPRMTLKIDNAPHKGVLLRHYLLSVESKSCPVLLCLCLLDAPSPLLSCNHCFLKGANSPTRNTTTAVLNDLVDNIRWACVDLQHMLLHSDVLDGEQKATAL